ncbi:uncharacterized protein METZ01_LOCUS382428 [marine metagenome]|uniref:Uncharacterized protein n=1 Tax=marine metagenome TaxID=408172 RepID=A0A382U5J5_9ZZZZ
MSDTLNSISWIVAAIVTLTILIVGFGNTYYLIFNETVGVFGAGGYLLAIFLHLQSTNLRRDTPPKTIQQQADLELSQILDTKIDN